MGERYNHDNQSTALAKHTDVSSGEEIELQTHLTRPGETPLSLRDETFLKASKVPATKAQAKILRHSVDDKTEADILPSGEVYMSHVFVRRRLNDAYQPGGWAMRPLTSATVDPVTNVMYREYALMINGVVAATAYGSTKYQPNNKRMDFADAAEAVKSNALTRCAKDLGIGSECWDRRWCDRWRNQFAVQVWAGYRASDGTIKVDAYWRRTDAQPFKGEVAVVEGSPNRSSVASLPEADDFRKAKQFLENRVRQQPQPMSPQAPAPPAQQGGESTQARGSQHPGQVNAKLSPYLIRNLRVSGNGRSKLYEVEMFSGRKIYTFSTTVYARCQHAFASREAVEIVAGPEKWQGHEMIAQVLPYRES